MNCTTILVRNEPRVDTRMLAEHLGNGHRPTMALIDKYKPQFENLGKVLFQKTPSPDARTGQKQRSAMLNEDQTFFLLSLSRNNERTVQLKLMLINAFREARRSLEQRETEYLPTYHLLHDRIKELANGAPNERFMHMNANRLVNQVAGIDAGQRNTIPLALLTVAQQVAASALVAAPDAKTGYERAKAALLPLGAAMRLESIGHRAS